MSCEAKQQIAGPRIRAYRDGDRDDVQRLYREGLLIGEPNPDDPAPDLADVSGHYFLRAGDHFWVAEEAGRIVGMVGVTHRTLDVSLLRRLRVEPNWQGTDLCCRLIETALVRCRRLGDLKVVLDTHLYGEAARRLFSSLGFMYSRGRDARGKQILEFYINLYNDPRAKRTKGTTEAGTAHDCAAASGRDTHHKSTPADRTPRS